MALSRWHKKQKELRKYVKNSHIYSIFGERILHSSLWKIDKRSVSGGLSVGVFIAFTPTIPLQMVFAGFGAILLRVNVPLAMAAVWITNPFTAVPIYIASWKLGRMLMQRSLLLTEFFEQYPEEARIIRIIEQSVYLWTGAFVYGILAALCANLVVRVFWTSVRSMLEHHRKA